MAVRAGCSSSIRIAAILTVMGLPATHAAGFFRAAKSSAARAPASDSALD